MAVYIDISALHISYDALETSEKVLTLFFLVLLFLVNFFLVIVRILQYRSQIFSQTKHAIHLSLSVAGIVLALFTQVVYAVVLFKQYGHSVNCTTANLARIYSQKCLPVVYGIGLCILAADLILRARRVSFTTRSSNYYVASCVCFMTPWLLALVIVCPLTFSGIDWSKFCEVTRGKPHLQAEIIVCTILPVVAVLVMALAVLFSSRSVGGRLWNSFDSPMFESYDHANSVLQTVSSIPLKNRYVVQESKELGSKRASPKKELEYSFRKSNLTYPEHSMKRDITVLFLVCLIFVITVIPYNSLCLYITENFYYTGPFMYQVEKSTFIMLDIFMWLQNLYPVLIPIMWGLFQ